MNSVSVKFKWAIAGAMAMGALLAGTAANAGVSWSVGVNVPGLAVGVAEPAPVYYAPAPVYSAPAPVYYRPAPPVYYAPPVPVYEQRPAPVYYSPPPPPVYYRPAPVYYESGRGYYEQRRHWRREGWGPGY